MNLTEKTAYLKGLMEGLDLGDSKEAKVLNAMLELLDDLARTVADLDADLDQVYDELDAIDEDLSDIEEVIFDDEDEDEEDDDCDCDCDCCDCYDCYEVTCPACGAIVEADEEILLSDDFSCPNCGEKFEIDFDEDDEEVGVDGEEA